MFLISPRLLTYRISDILEVSEAVHRLKPGSFTRVTLSCTLSSRRLSPGKDLSMTLAPFFCRTVRPLFCTRELPCHTCPDRLNHARIGSQPVTIVSDMPSSSMSQIPIVTNIVEIQNSLLNFGYVPGPNCHKHYRDSELSSQFCIALWGIHCYSTYCSRYVIILTTPICYDKG